MEDFRNGIRTAILEQGYQRAITAWTSSPEFRSLPTEVQPESFDYFCWVRNLILQFERYGAPRSRRVLLAMRERGQISAGIRNEIAVFNSWATLYNESDEYRPRLRGWMQLAPEDLVQGREERARRLSLDGVSDVLFEPTESDTAFAEMFGPVSYRVSVSFGGGEEVDAEAETDIEEAEGQEADEPVEFNEEEVPDDFGGHANPPPPPHARVAQCPRDPPPSCGRDEPI